LSDDGSGGFRFQFAGVISFGGFPGFSGRLLSPGFNPAFSQQFGENFLFIGRQIFRTSQNLIQSHGIHHWIVVR